MATGTEPGYLKSRVERAHEDLKWARGAWERGEYRLSLNRSYYAVFHLTTAVLNTLGIVRKKHSGVEGAFAQFLVKPRRVEAEYATLFHEARLWRENADYELAAEFTRERTGDILNKAERLVARLERMLREGGHLPAEEEDQ